MKKTFYQFANSKGLTSEDALFCHLICVLGYPLAQSYQISYRGSNANLSSCAALASRKVRDLWVQKYIKELLLNYNNTTIELKDLCL